MHGEEVFASKRANIFLKESDITKGMYGAAKNIHVMLNMFVTIYRVGKLHNHTLSYLCNSSHGIF